MSVCSLLLPVFGRYLICTLLHPFHFTIVVVDAVFFLACLVAVAAIRVGTCKSIDWGVDIHEADTFLC